MASIVAPAVTTKPFTGQAFFSGFSAERRLPTKRRFPEVRPCVPLPVSPLASSPSAGSAITHAVSGQPAQVLLGRRVGVHVQIHGGGDDHRAAGGEVGRQQQVVGDAGRHFGQCIGRGGGDQVAVGPFAERDMGIPGPVLGVEELHEDRVSGERGHRQGRDELLRQRSHHHAHVGAGRLQ